MSLDWEKDMTPEMFGEEFQAIIEIIGLEKFFLLVDILGGDSIYIPKKDTLTRSVRNKKIRSEFNGFNYTNLAKKYALSTRTIRDIVKEV